MAKSGNSGSGYAPLNYFDRLKIRAATKHLHSRYASVRHAAHNEIARILKRRQQSLRARLNPRKWARHAWERANYGKLNKCGNCEHATRDKDMFRHHVNSHMRQAAAEARQAGRPSASRGPQGRTDPAGARVHDPDMRRQERTQSPARPQARTQDVRRQAGLLPQDQKLRPWSGRVEPQPQGGPARQPNLASRPGPATNATLRQAARQAASEARDRSAPARPDGLRRMRRATAAAASPPRAPNAPDPRAPAPTPARTPPLPHETVRAPRTPKARLRMPRLRARA